MDFIKSLVLFGLVFSFFMGQLARISIYGFSFPAIDLFIILFSLLNLFDHRHHLIPTNKKFVYFIFFAIFTFIINLIWFHFPISKSFLYLIRLICLLSLLIWTPVVSKNTKQLFVLSIIANILFGLFQYIVWPDFTYFNSLNWDPHLSRLVSTFFDPTFTGLIYLMFLIYIYLNKPAFPRITYYALLITTYAAIALTYSRSTYLSLFIVSFFIAQKLKRQAIFIFTTLLIVLTILILPRPYGEGTKLERTSSIKAKIVNYQEGLSVFATSPLIGHGYNNLFYVRHITNVDSHANSGFDGSLMTILTTTGIIGLCLFLSGFIDLFKHSSLLKQSLLVIILIHSFFANSLLYPWTLVFFILI